MFDMKEAVYRLIIKTGNLHFCNSTGIYYKNLFSVEIRIMTV